jgi:hypothetical protein
MNNKQRKICWATLVLFCLSLLAVPVVTFNGSWTGSHVVGDIQYIPFFSVRASEKVRMDILTIEWIGISAVSIILCMLFKGRFDQSPPTIEKVQKRSIFWKSMKVFLIAILTLTLIFLGIFASIKWNEEQDRIKNNELERTCISEKEISITKLKFGVDSISANKTTYFISGDVQNLSKDYRLKSIKITVYVNDILSNGHIEEMDKEQIFLVDGNGYNGKIPPQQTSSFRKLVTFTNLPIAYGKITWSYKIDDISGELDDRRTQDQVPQKYHVLAQGMTTKEAEAFLDAYTLKSQNNTNQMTKKQVVTSATNSGLFDDLLEDTNSKTSNNPFADLPDKKTNGKK